MIDILSPLIKKFLPFAKQRMGFNDPPRLFLKNDEQNSNNPLGKTAYYDPGQKSITLYITGRHPKDIMRSLSHELVHHSQNCRGEFDDASDTGVGYAQNDEHLRGMEREAYEVGNMCFRDWEDSIKQTIYFEHLQKGDNKMSTKDWKNKEISTLLSEAWGFKFNTLEEFNEFNGEGELQAESEEEIEERRAPRLSGHTGTTSTTQGSRTSGRKSEGDPEDDRKDEPLEESEEEVVEEAEDMEGEEEETTEESTTDAESLREAIKAVLAKHLKG